MNTKLISINTWAIVTAMLATLSFASCESDNNHSDRTLVFAEDLLEDAIYLQVADEEQPAWLQSQIAMNPYLRVFRSDNENAAYLLHAPMKGNQLSVFDKYGKEQPLASEEQLQQFIQEGKPWTLTHIYSFPLKPGDAEWDISKYTIPEIKEKLQLPADILYRMATSDLIETCLDYQYSLDFLFADEIQRGVEYVRQDFNGLDELLKRENLAEAMLRKYEVKMRTANVMNTQEALIKGNYSLDFMLFKMLLAQDEMLNQLNREQLRQLIKLSMKADEMVIQMPDLFGTTHYIQTLFLYSRIIVREGGFTFASEEEKSKLEYFAQTCTGDPMVLSMFTDAMRQRMYSYLESL